MSSLILHNDCFNTLVCIDGCPLLVVSHSLLSFCRISTFFYSTTHFLLMSYFDVRKRSPIEAFRNFIPCGVHSCKFSCVENSIVCEICLKHYHYTCRNLSKRKYLRITEKKCSYICSKECYSSIFPFWNIDDVDFQNMLYDEAPNPWKNAKEIVYLRL